MKRHSALGSRLSPLGVGIALVATAVLASCSSDKARADSVAAAARRDSALREEQKTSDALAAKLRAERDSADAAARKASGKSTRSKTTATQKVLGRDSVRQGPIMGVPSIVDTAKRRPPR